MSNGRESNGGGEGDLHHRPHVDHTYRDFSRYLEDGGAIKRHKKSGNNFPAKLHQILSNDEFSDIIAWMPHGRAFKIQNKDLFIKQAAPSVNLNQTKYESFLRQLSGWGFKRLYQPGADYGCYYHECFLRGLPKLTALMNRADLHGKPKPKPYPEGEPNFYDISQQYPLPPTPRQTAASQSAPEMIPTREEWAASRATASSSTPGMEPSYSDISGSGTEHPTLPTVHQPANPTGATPASSSLSEPFSHFAREPSTSSATNNTSSTAGMHDYSSQQNPRALEAAWALYQTEETMAQSARIPAASTFAQLYFPAQYGDGRQYSQTHDTSEVLEGAPPAASSYAAAAFGTAAYSTQANAQTLWQSTGAGAPVHGSAQDVVLEEHTSHYHPHGTQDLQASAAAAAANIAHADPRGSVAASYSRHAYAWPSPTRTAIHRGSTQAFDARGTTHDPHPEMQQQQYRGSGAASSAGQTVGQRGDHHAREAETGEEDPVFVNDMMNLFDVWGKDL